MFGLGAFAGGGGSVFAAPAVAAWTAVDHRGRGYSSFWFLLGWAAEVMPRNNRRRVAYSLSWAVAALSIKNKKTPGTKSATFEISHQNDGLI